jgi:hypothetical protein
VDRYYFRSLYFREPNGILDLRGGTALAGLEHRNLALGQLKGPGAAETEDLRQHRFIPDADYDAWADRLKQRRVPSSGPVDRYYFRSLYLTSPSGSSKVRARRKPRICVSTASVRSGCETVRRIGPRARG